MYNEAGSQVEREENLDKIVSSFLFVGIASFLFVRHLRVIKGGSKDENKF